MEDVPAEYTRLLTKAKGTDLARVEATGVVKVPAGRYDSEGLPFVVLTPAALGTTSKDDALLQFVRDVDAISHSQFRLVVINSGDAITMSLVLWCLRVVRPCLPRRYRKNLAAVTIIHPTMVVRIAGYVVSPFVSEKLWSKVQYADRVEELELDGTFDAETAATIVTDGVRGYEKMLVENSRVSRANARQLGIPIAPDEDSSTAPPPT